MVPSPLERKALVLSTFAASCICFAPAEMVTGVVLLIAFGLLYRWDLKLSRTEGQDLTAPAKSDAPG